MDLLFSDLAVFPLVVSAIFAAVVWTLHSWSRRTALLLGGLLTCLVFVLRFSGYISVCFPLQMACTALPKNIRCRTRVLISSVIIVGSFALFTSAGKARIAELYQLRAQYPVTSLEERLAFETEGLSRYRKQVASRSVSVDPDATLPNATSQASKISSPVEQRLANLESDPRSENTARGWAFRELHQREREKFEVARGFGMVRMMDLAFELRWIENYEKKEELDVLKSEEEGESESFIEFNGTTIRRADDSSVASVSIPTIDRLLGLHTNEAGDFLRPGDFGYVAAKRQAAGFRSHAFHQPKPSVTTEDPDVQWSIRRLELVSLLRFETPRVYVTQRLPNLEHLKAVPTRQLNEFEESNLPKLYRDEDVVLQESAGSILMLGSLRANKTCLKCHSVERGELLGAFSYELRLAKVQSLLK